MFKTPLQPTNFCFVLQNLGFANAINVSAYSTLYPAIDCLNDKSISVSIANHFRNVISGTSALASFFVEWTLALNMPAESKPFDWRKIAHKYETADFHIYSFIILAYQSKQSNIKSSSPLELQHLVFT